MKLWMGLFTVNICQNNQMSLKGSFRIVTALFAKQIFKVARSSIGSLILLLVLRQLRIF